MAMDTAGLMWQPEILPMECWPWQQSPVRKRGLSSGRRRWDLRRYNRLRQLCRRQTEPKTKVPINSATYFFIFSIKEPPLFLGIQRKAELRLNPLYCHNSNTLFINYQVAHLVYTKNPFSCTFIKVSDGFPAYACLPLCTFAPYQQAVRTIKAAGEQGQIPVVCLQFFRSIPEI